METQMVSEYSLPGVHPWTMGSGENSLYEIFYIDGVTLVKINITIRFKYTIDSHG